MKAENIGNLLVQQGIPILFINLGHRNVSNFIHLITIFFMKPTISSSNHGKQLVIIVPLLSGPEL